MARVDNNKQITDYYKPLNPPVDPSKPKYQLAYETTLSTLKDRTLKKIDQWDAKVEKAIPTFLFQAKLDAIGTYIESAFAPFKKFDQWLEKNHGKNWQQELAFFLLKLPMKAVRNVVMALVNVVKGIFYTAVHPIKAANHLAKLIVTLLFELTKPEVWTKIGAGMIGASIGQAVVMQNPLSVIGLVLGAAFIAAGFLGGITKDLIQQDVPKWEAIKHTIQTQLKSMPEAALTGFCFGILLGGIQRAIEIHQLNTFKISSLDEAKQFADQFIKDNNLPAYERLDLNQGNITLRWSDAQSFKVTNPDLYRRLIFQSTSDIQIHLGPKNAYSSVHFRGWQFEGYDYWNHTPLNDLGIQGPFYPTPPASAILANGVPIASGLEASNT